MASASGSVSAVPVVLRVKRKREEGPADALGNLNYSFGSSCVMWCVFAVVAKIAKLDPSLCDNCAGMNCIRLLVLGARPFTGHWGYTSLIPRPPNNNNNKKKARKVKPVS